jgi:hypothetical protein
MITASPVGRHRKLAYTEFTSQEKIQGASAGIESIVDSIPTGIASLGHQGVRKWRKDEEDFLVASRDTFVGLLRQYANSGSRWP